MCPQPEFTSVKQAKHQASHEYPHLRRFQPLSNPLVFAYSKGIMSIQPMTSYAEQHLPDICVQEGMDCNSCTSSTARELARACPSLPTKLITQLFVQIHTYSACARMHANFTRAYAEAMETAEVLPIKKPMGTCRTLAAATAVA